MEAKKLKMLELKKKSKNKEKFVFSIYILVIFLGIFITYKREVAPTFSMPINLKNIVIDAGHGGWDPGKVATDGSKEKDINLEIAKKLQTYLEQSGSFVLTTRITDTALSESKRDDLKQRKELANSSNIDLLISIHQNSFPSSSVKGAQVFYYDGKDESKVLAECIQERLKSIDNTNNRVAKANSSYYLLKQTNIPAVIVECGFLSNLEEGELLKSEEYQEKIAWAIYCGILDYYNED